jgi:uncharacterized protein YuzE
MKLSYFEDTDTLYIEFKSTNITESKDIDENTVIDLDNKGNLLAITVEHASTRVDIKKLTISGFAC